MKNLKKENTMNESVHFTLYELSRKTTRYFLSCGNSIATMEEQEREEK